MGPRTSLKPGLWTLGASALFIYTNDMKLITLVFLISTAAQAAAPRKIILTGPTGAGKAGSVPSGAIRIQMDGTGWREIVAAALSRGASVTVKPENQELFPASLPLVTQVGGFDAKVKAAEAMGMRPLAFFSSRGPRAANDAPSRAGSSGLESGSYIALGNVSKLFADNPSVAGYRFDDQNSAAHAIALPDAPERNPLNIDIRRFASDQPPEASGPSRTVSPAPLPFLNAVLPDGRRVTTDANGVFSISPAGQKITVRVPDGTYAADHREQYLLRHGVPQSAIRRSMVNLLEGEETLEFDLTPEQYQLLLGKGNIKESWVVKIETPAYRPVPAATMSAGDIAVGKIVRIGQHQGTVVEMNRDHIVLDTSDPAKKAFTLIPATSMSGPFETNAMPSVATGWRLASVGAAAQLFSAAVIPTLLIIEKISGAPLPLELAAPWVVALGVGGLAAAALLGIKAHKLGRSILAHRGVIHPYWKIYHGIDELNASRWLRPIQPPPLHVNLRLLGLGAIAAGFAFFDSASAWQPALALPGFGLFMLGEWTGDFPETAAAFWERVGAFLCKTLGLATLFAASTALVYPFAHIVSLDQIASLPAAARFGYFAGALIAAAAGAALAWPKAWAWWKSLPSARRIAQAVWRNLGYFLGVACAIIMAAGVVLLYFSPELGAYVMGVGFFTLGLPAAIMLLGR